MKFTKTLIAAALLAGAGAAQADFSTDAVLSIFDYTNGKSFSIDTGVAFSALTPNGLGTAASDTDAQQAAFQADLSGFNNFTVAGNANLAALIAAEGAHDRLYWTINATDGNDLISTFTTASAATVNSSLQLLTTGGAFNNSAASVYTEVTAQSALAAPTASSIFVGTTQDANAAKYGLNAQGQEGALVNAATVGSNLNLWAVYVNQSSTDNLANNYGALNLALNGTTATLTVVPAAAPAAVPLPTTAWMFLSGVLGLLASKRRNSAI